MYRSLIGSINLQIALQRLVKDAKERKLEESFSDDGNGATLITPCRIYFDVGIPQ